MKSGRTLNELAAELDRQAKSKRDFLADSRRLSLRPAEDGSVFLDGINGGMPLRDTAHKQLAGALAIPTVYYERMLAEAPDLLAANVNRWLEKQPARKLVRTLDGRVRAFLSDSYRPLDNIDLAEAVLPKLSRLGATVVSGEVTESRFYLKAVTDRVRGEVKLGDVIQAGVAVSNSEIGQGSLRVEALDFRLVCKNGMIREAAVRKAHLGRGSRGQDVIEDSREYFRDETRRLDDAAFFAKVQDATAAIFDPARFELRLGKYREAGDHPIAADPAQVVELTARKFDLPEAVRTSVLQHLIRGADLSQYGLGNAVTRASQDVESYDDATNLEAVGGRVIELSPSEWKVLAN